MLSKKVVYDLSNSSVIRAMFEQGAKLRAQFGADKVYDFSLGNPDDEPPAAVKESMKKYILGDMPGLHRYMNNAGHPDVREKVAKSIEAETGVAIKGDHIVMTVGAAGGLNVIFKTILNPDEEVIAFTPYFVEYGFYAGNHGGKLVTIPATENFQPNVEAFEKAITPKTKAVIINSPNNPTGVIYTKENLEKINAVLEAKQKEFNTTIFVVSDEPYVKLVYDNVKIPQMLNIFKNVFVVNSFSKSLGLPGERIGFIAVNPAIEGIDMVMNGLIFANRTLGYVNAPALFQKVIADSLDATVNIENYQKRRDFLYDMLTRIGFSCVKPEGAFYLFPKCPIPEAEFIEKALKYNLILVPGSGFGTPGYFRISYCVSMKTIENSVAAFEALAKEVIG